MKFAPTARAIILFSLLVITVGAIPRTLSISKRSVTDVDEDVVSIRKLMKTLNMTIGKFINKIEGDMAKDLLDCEDIHSIIKRSAYVDPVSIATMMDTLNMTLEKVIKKLESCLPKNSLTCKEEPKNCAEVLKKCGGNQSGVYEINPDGRGAFKVYCDQKTSGGGWTVFQRRQDGSVDFYRGWNDYKNGFGNLYGEFWLGLDKINRLTNSSPNRVRVDLEDHEGNQRYAEYDYFAVADEANKYRLELAGYTGTANDSLLFHRGQPFTTKDRENDGYREANCAVIRKGAWWFTSCMHSHLNGVYYQKPGVSHAQGINWYKWKGDSYSLKKADMKLRPTCMNPR